MKQNLPNGGVFVLVLVVLAFVLVGGGITYFATQKQLPENTESPAAIEKEDEDAVMKKDEMAMEKKEGETMMEKKNGEMMSAEGGSASGGKYSGAVLAGTKAPLLDFKKSDYDTAFQSDKLIVLYFYANWCPICKAEFPLLEAAFNELQSDKVIGFRVNFNDNETDADETNLARQFGVAYQHTKVFVKNKERVLKAPDGWTKDRYLTEINKFIAP